MLKERYKPVLSIIWALFIFGRWALVGCLECEDAGDPNVIFKKESDDMYSLRINENVPKAKLLLLVDDHDVPINLEFADGICADFKSFYKIEDGALVLNGSLDYEQDNCQKIRFDLSGDTTPTVIIYVGNLDDNQPQFISDPKCVMEENTIYNQHNTSCQVKIKDLDGMLDEPTFLIQEGNKPQTIFEATYAPDETNEKEAFGLIYLQDKIELNYEETIFYILTITAKGPVYNNSIQVVVNVKDMPDQPPKWMTMTNTLEFEENVNQKFNVTAVDGDVGIGNSITYTITQNGCNEKNNDCSIDISPNGEVSITNVDREKVGNTLLLQIAANEIVKVPAEGNSSLLNITLFIDDQNDNEPVIEISGDSSFLDFKGDKDDEVVFSIEENYLGAVSSFSVTDMDLASSGTYNLEMISGDGTIDYTEPFQVIPASGYQKSNFTLTVSDSSKLNFEDALWKTIKFELRAIEEANSSHIGSKNIVIKLKDVNDEFPIFVNKTDSVSIPEDIHKGDVIFNAEAKDEDAGDKVSYEIVGIFSENLNISEEGIISTIKDNVFDYEQLQQVVLQIKASDSVNHITYKTLTIDITDVDDEPPTITVGKERVTIEENCTVGTEPKNALISASDPDSKPKLDLEIDWSQSFITKNSALVDADKNKWQCFELDDEPTDNSRKITKTLKTSKTCKPDFEIFDAITIGLKVTDNNTKIGTNFSTGSILVNIVDINDNAPIFIDSSLDGLEVSDGAAGLTKIGTIAAHDDDITDKVTYAIKSLDSGIDWIDVDENTGLLTVKENVIIDDDIPKRMNISCEIYAYDNNKTHETKKKISIHLVDINDKSPVIQKDKPNKTIPEKTLNGTLIIQLIVTDADRDDPFNKTIFKFDSTISEEASNCFSIDSDGKITVDLKNGAILDRDFGSSQYTLPIQVHDNPKGTPQNPDQFTFTVFLDDVNDQKPTVVNKSINCYENMTKGSLIGSIVGEDADGPGPNSEIHFEIVDIVPIFGTSAGLDKSYFKIGDEDEKQRIATIQLLGDLKDHYGSYNLSILTTDGGTPPLSTTNYLLLTIEKFNFEQPVFTYPHSEDQIILDKDQDTSSESQLILFGGELLSDFEVDDNQGHKWEISFNITKQENSADELFILKQRGVYTTRLHFSRKPTEEDYKARHKIYIEANVKSDRLPGEAPTTAQTTLYIVFFSSSEPPVFDITTGEVTLQENSTDVSSAIPHKATNPMANMTNPFYNLLNETDTFEVDPKSGDIGVRVKLDYEKETTYSLYIQATNSMSNIPTPTDHSLLKVKINVEDVNDNAPVFFPSQFYGAFLKYFTKSSIILTINATDEDSFDKQLKFSLSSKANCTGLLDPTTEQPFNIGDTDGKITPNFTVTSDMSGYCTFLVFVADRADKKDKFCPEGHTVSTSVQINIISDDELVEFTFSNEDWQVNVNRDKITDRVNDIFKQYGYQSKMADLSHNSETNTTVHFYFLDKKQMPIKADLILGNLTASQNFNKLKTELNEIGIFLADFSDDSVIQALDDYLKTWLLAITCILATLLVLLSVSFFFRNRTLSRRIQNLSTTKFGSQESGLNRAGIAAPTTNRNAVEGSNPIYNSENLVKELEPDRDSVLSNDSDLFGVEDNPEFEM